MNDNTLMYFAYGSNMSVLRLQDRVPSAQPIGVGWLRDYRLMFRKRSKKDGSGKCDIVKASASVVYGVLFEIASSDEPELDRHEGLNYGYLKKPCSVQVDDTRCMPAFLYFAAASHVDEKLKPYTWYSDHALIGAREAALPQMYMDEISATESIRDKDREREKRERILYEGHQSSPWRQPEQVLEHPNLVDCRRP